MSQDDPSKRMAAQALGLLVTVARAAGGAAFCIRGRSIELWHAAGVGQRAIDRVGIACRLGLDGEPFLVHEDYAILTARVGAEAALAFYLERPAEGGDYRAELLRLANDVARCVASREGGAPPARSSYLDRRHALAELCEREEWNVARMARRLQKSRMTVYRMLREHGLERPGGPRRCFGRT